MSHNKSYVEVAMDDRCGHMNALLSIGNLSNDNHVTCPFHWARFDVTNGRKVKEPILTPSQEMEPLPKNMAKVFGIRSINESY